jgi:hypothetical protein
MKLYPIAMLFACIYIAELTTLPENESHLHKGLTEYMISIMAHDDGNGNFVYLEDKPTPNDYYSNRTGKYLGSDGSKTKTLRLIDEEKFKKIKKEYVDLKSEKATSRLQSESRVIKVDNQKIQSDLQKIADTSLSNKIEFQVYLYLDIKTAIISSAMGEPGTNTQADISYTSNKEYGVSFCVCDTDNSKILIGQAHSHPESTNSKMGNSIGMSPKDSEAAMDMQIPIYGIDAYYHAKGEQTGINRVTPDGTRSITIAHTNGIGSTIEFNIAFDALRIWGQSGIPKKSK